MEELKAGQEYTVRTVVEKQQLAVNVGSGTLEVLATPAVAALMEKAAWELLADYLPEGITTVGTKIQIDHVRATPEGGSVSVTATLTEIDGRRYVFAVIASDEKGIIAQGTHERFAVRAERFMEKARS